MIGRVSRARNGATTAGYVMVPDDPDLRRFARAIEEDVSGFRGENAVGAAQLRDFEVAGSKFESHAAMHSDGGIILGESSANALGVDQGNEWADAQLSAAATPCTFAEFPDASLLADRKGNLRKLVWGKVCQVARRFSKEPRDVYTYWTRRDGATVSNATVKQLAARLRSMDTWIKEGFCPVR